MRLIISFLVAFITLIAAIIGGMVSAFTGGLK